jgi:hypothetical protein
MLHIAKEIEKRPLKATYQDSVGRAMLPGKGWEEKPELNRNIWISRCLLESELVKVFAPLRNLGA